MEEGVEQVNYFKTQALMTSKNLVKTGTAQVATQQSQVTAGTAQGTTCEIVWCSSDAVCVAAAVLGSSPVPLVKPPEAPWLPPPFRKQA